MTSPTGAEMMYLPTATIEVGPGPGRVSAPSVDSIATCDV
jgi:hypothetical protein